MEAFVVNLARRQDRRRRFTSWNGRPGLAFRFQTAVNGARVSREVLRMEGVLGDDHQCFTNGAIGNALSHRDLWRRAAESGLPTIICEDDCCMRADFVEAAEGIISTLPLGWDIAFFGYNTDAAVAVQTTEGLKAVLIFDEAAKRHKGYFDAYAGQVSGLGPSTLLRCFQRWGTLCYVVSPTGAAKLERQCFPLSTRAKVVMFGQNRLLVPNGLDGMLNLALQRTDIDAYCVFPPLALSENALSDSDVST